MFKHIYFSLEQTNLYKNVRYFIIINLIQTIIEYIYYVNGTYEGYVEYIGLHHIKDGETPTE